MGDWGKQGGNIQSFDYFVLIENMGEGFLLLVIV